MLGTALDTLLGSIRESSRARKVAKRREREFKRRLKRIDSEARDIVLRVKDYTMLHPDKLFSFIEAVRYVCKYNIDGDIAECGVWRGGAVMAAALTCEKAGDCHRKFYLYDTFSGMSAPTDRDRSLVGDEDTALEFRQKQTGPESSDWCFAGIEDVQSNIATLGYEEGKFIFVKGKVEDTIPETLPEKIAILRLDTDWYESTKHEMEYLMPRLVSKGVLIVDDYHRWAGNQEAVDEYLSRHNVPMLLTKVGRSAIGVRP